MAAPLPVLILATPADLDAVARDAQTGQRRALRAFSVQVSGLSPQVTLSAEKALNSGYRASGWTEALAMGVPAAALAAGVGAHVLGALIAPMTIAGIAIGLGGLSAAFGALLARRRARKRMVRALAQLRDAMAQRGDPHHPVAGRRRGGAMANHPAGPVSPAPVAPQGTAAADVLVLAEQRARADHRATRSVAEPPQPVAVLR